jgi:hypothetical protein
MIRVRCLYPVLAIMIAELLFAYPGFAQPDDTIRSVEAAWKNREHQIQSLWLEWEDTVTTKKAAITAELSIKNSKDESLPKSDHTHRGSHTFVIDRDKMRYEVRSKVFMTSKEDWVDWNHDAVFDGTTGLSFEDQPSLPFRTAQRVAAKVPPAFRTPVVFAVIQDVRPLAMDLCPVRLSDFRSSGRKATIRGHECVELIPIRKSADASCSVWTDPKLGHLIVRWQQDWSRRGAITSARQDDIEYKEHEPGIWLPASWSATRQGGKGDHWWRIEARMVRVEVDIRPTASVFDTSPPPNSVFTDTKADGTWRESVIREDGSSTTVTPATREAAIRELMGQPSQRPHGWWSRNRYIIVIIVAVCLFTVLALVRRRRFAASK